MGVKGRWTVTGACGPYNLGGSTTPTARLDLYACHDLPQCLTMGRVHTTSVRSLRKLVGHFASPDRPPPATSKRNTELKMLL